MGDEKLIIIISVTVRGINDIIPGKIKTCRASSLGRPTE